MTQTQLDELNVQSLWQFSLRTVTGTQTVTGYFIDAYGTTYNTSLDLTTSASGLTKLYRTWVGDTAANIPTPFISLVLKPTAGIIVQNNGTLGNSLTSWGSTSVTLSSGAWRLLGVGTIADVVFQSNEETEVEDLVGERTETSLAAVLAQILPATGTGVPIYSEYHPGLEYVCGLGSGGTTTVILEALGPTKRVVATGVSVTFSTSASGLAASYNAAGGTFNASTMKAMRILSVSGVPFVRNTGGDGLGAVTVAPVDGTCGITLAVGDYSQQDVGFGWGYGA